VKALPKKTAELAGDYSSNPPYRLGRPGMAKGATLLGSASVASNILEAGSVCTPPLAGVRGRRALDDPM